MTKYRCKLSLWFIILVIQPICSYAIKDNTVFENIAAAQLSIERMRKAPNPNWNEIRAVYDLCRPLVAEIDRKHNLTYQTQIDDALRVCALGQHVKVQQQTLAKGLQHAVVLKISDLLQQMAMVDVKERKAAVEHISSLFEGIRPTFIRRDKDFFENREILEKRADQALADLAKTSKTGGTDCFMAAHLLKECIYRTYALSFLFEMLEIETYRDANLGKCEVKLAEAKIFYRIIEPIVKKSNRTGHRIITTSLSGVSYAAINAGQLEQILNNSLPGGKIR